MQNIFNKIEEKGISIHRCESQGVFEGFELNTYTDGGVNQIIFIDYRDTDKSPENPEDFKTLFNERIASIDIDEEIEMNRQDSSYRQAFTLTQSLKDFKAWKKSLKKLAKSLNN